MTFDAQETSVDSGAPVFLYDFSAGAAHWRYTSADRTITSAGVTFAPLAITAGNIVQGQEIKQKTLKVTVPLDAPIVAQLQAYPPSTDLLLTVWALHYTDPDAQAIVAWIGRLRSQMQKGTVVELACEPAYTGIQTAGLRRRWQVNCPHVLYAQGSCNLLAATYKVTGTLAGVASGGIQITSPAFVLPAGLSFAGGWVEWDSGFEYLERRTINSVSGTTLTLAYGSPGLIGGMSVNAYPGCNHSAANCEAFPVAGSTSGNILNYGGALYIPLKNPMDGNPVYD